ncbi:MAG: fluoride efflux transporter CrcB [Chitinophagaceae bacterium]
MLRNILFVALGGSMGSVFRYLTNLLFPNKQIPIATFLVNIIGSFLIGLLMGYLVKQSNAQTCQLLLITGFCGGFTTFSAFSWDVVLMLQQQRFATAFGYILCTFFIGVAATLFGFWLSK